MKSIDEVVLNAICGHVASHEPYRKTTIGATAEVVDWIRRELGHSTKAAERALKRLFESGCLGPWTDDYTNGLPDSIGITAKGWEKWKGFSRAYVERSFGRSFDEWRGWDGIAGRDIVGNDKEYPFKFDDIWA